MEDLKYSKLITVLGGRKFIFALGLCVTVCALFAFGDLSEPGFIDLVKWTAAGYLGANTTAKFGSK